MRRALTKALAETCHLAVNIPSTCSHESFRHGTRGYQDFGVGFQHLDACISTRFAQNNRHKRRRIDGLGSPFPS
jgi:hypothetical protein